MPMDALSIGAIAAHDGSNWQAADTRNSRPLVREKCDRSKEPPGRSRFAPGNRPPANGSRQGL